MANFMINDLSNGNILNNDNFLKSDSNGVLSKVAFSDIKNALFTNGIVGSNISIPFYADNSIFTNDISTTVTAGMHKVELKLSPQSSDVTLTLLQFTTFKVIGFQF